MKLRELHELLREADHLERDVLDAERSLEHGGDAETMEHKSFSLKMAQHRLDKHLDTEIEL